LTTEKAQREAYRKTAVAGRQRRDCSYFEVENCRRLVAADEALATSANSGIVEMLEEFVDDRTSLIGEIKTFLSQLVHPASNKDILTSSMKYDELKALMRQQIRPKRIQEGGASSVEIILYIQCALYFDELVLRAKGTNGSEQHDGPVRLEK
jgi:hypothetical protein